MEMKKGMAIKREQGIRIQKVLIVSYTVNGIQNKVIFAQASE
jgi:hypothetical protein